MFLKCCGNARITRSLPKKMEKHLYITTLRTFVYGTETQSLKTNYKKKLFVLERKILQTIFGPVKNTLAFDKDK